MPKRSSKSSSKSLYTYTWKPPLHGWRWYPNNVITTNTTSITAMSPATVEQLIENMKAEEMRKKRAQAKIDKFYKEEFIEDVAEPFVGYKMLAIASPASIADIIEIPNYAENNEIQEGAKLLREHGIVARSQSNWAFWTPDGLTATCKIALENRTGGHDLDHVPYPSCTCGIYAYKAPFVPRSWRDFDPTTIVVEVLLGGYVMPHTMGYKAQHARISKIITPLGHPFSSSFNQLANIYDVPIVSHESMGSIYSQGSRFG